jgi:hypothetical protein
MFTVLVLTFLAGWTERLHEHGYRSAVHGTVASLIADLVAAPASYPIPDAIDFARWNGEASVSDPAIPSGYWACHCRVHQYSGRHAETFGGVTLTISEDYWDIKLS